MKSKLTKVTNNPHQNPSSHLTKTAKKKKKKKPKYMKNNSELGESGDGPIVKLLLL